MTSSDPGIFGLFGFLQVFPKNSPVFHVRTLSTGNPGNGARRLLSHPRWQRRFQGDAAGSVWRTGTAENLESA
jgi:hypothetical protein